MTREEAIKIIEFVRNNALDFELDKALEMAIKTLEQEPCEDCISRKAVLDIINFEDKWLLDVKGHNADTGIAFSGMKSGIADLPPVRPNQKPECSCEQIKWERDTAIAQLKELGYGLGEKPKIGHWIVYGRRYEKIYECDNCKIESLQRGNYCPNCGCRMVESRKVRKRNEING